MIKVQTLAPLHHRHQPTTLPVPPHRHSCARLNGAEHRDQAIRDLIAGRDLPGKPELVSLRRRQILVGPPRGLCGTHRLVPHPPGERLCPVAEVLQEYSGRAQISARSPRREQRTQRAAQNKAVPPVQRKFDVVTKLRNKLRRDARTKWQSFVFHTPKACQRLWASRHLLVAASRPRCETSGLG